MSQERAKTKEKKTAKEDRSGSAPYTVTIDIDENARKAEGRVDGEMPAENIPLMISDFIMQTAMMEVEMDGSACPYDAMDKINEMVTYIAGGFAAIAGVRSTGGNAKAVRFINGTLKFTERLCSPHGRYFSRLRKLRTTEWKECMD